MQSIKPPNLIEMCGPLFMSCAVANNLIIRIEDTADGAKISLRHQALGAIPDQYREGIEKGWARMLNDVKTALDS